jgi:GrpB-like predicted nucleotidyltransferase (UPF0157 family)
VKDRAVSNPPESEYVQPKAIHNATITLADPDPAWPDLFTREADRISTALRRPALAVEHVGSTSVPGLAAKPIIDIALVVADSADEAAYVPDLEAAGYVLHVREPGWHEHRLLKRERPKVHLHVFTTGSSEVARMLLFRDRLRSRPDERELYESTKRELAAQRWTHVQDYADAKSAVVEGILARGVEA